MTTLEKLKEAYTEILTVCEKYVNEDYLSTYEFADVETMRNEAKNHLLIIDWNQKYGLNIEHDRQLYEREHVRIDDYRSFSYFANAEDSKEKGYGKYISWSDDGLQPKDEWLLCFGFPTGAYIFGEDYPTEIFQEFWEELKSYKPKYSDTANNNLFFPLESAKGVFVNFPDILKKHRDKYIAGDKARKIKKMEEELQKLKTNPLK